LNHPGERRAWAQALLDHPCNKVLGIPTAGVATLIRASESSNKRIRQHLLLPQKTDITIIAALIYQATPYTHT